MFFAPLGDHSSHRIYEQVIIEETGCLLGQEVLGLFQNGQFTCSWEPIQDDYFA